LAAWPKEIKRRFYGLCDHLISYGFDAMTATTVRKLFALKEEILPFLTI